MAAPKFSPTPAIDESRSYTSPPVVPGTWMPDRKADLVGFQPVGDQLGYQGPDQGYALKLAAGFVNRLALRPGEHATDAVAGCLGIALRRASTFSRAPVVHDLTIAFTIWGFLDPEAPTDLVAARQARFAGLGHGSHYTAIRTVTDEVPEATLRMTPAQVQAAYATDWRSLVGL